jgi:hypothetical protein
MTLPIDNGRRADALRRRAVELAQEARWEADRGRRNFLLDKARSAVSRRRGPLRNWTLALLCATTTSMTTSTTDSATAIGYY